MKVAGLSLRHLMYYIVYGFLYVLSLLPLRVLYLLSDLAYLLIYHVFQYRYKVVMNNLLIAFPEKTEEDRKKIAKKFYRNFADTFIETIKLISADEKFIRKHVVADFSIFDKIYAEGKKCQIHTGHNFNWEFASLALTANIPHKLLVVYMPIENKTFDRIFKKLRSKTNNALVSARNMRKEILPHRHDLYALGLVADQTPADPIAGYWVDFFGRPTSFVKAPEGGARIANIPVVFCYMSKIKRGYYSYHFEMGAEQPATLPKGELTKRYVEYLENVISRHPDMWLWSHRRWKIEWKPELGPVL
jgi:KDO2-lipid IV(A) lauroyltransferase